MKILIDTREQSPFTFDQISPVPDTAPASLKTGDYSLEGYESDICIERKTMVDLFGSCGKARSRFESEFKRMKDFTFAALIIESDWEAIYKLPPTRSRISPKTILRTLIAWHMRYNVKIWACPTRGFAESLTYLLLKRFYDDVQTGKIICQSTLMCEKF